MLTQRRRTAGLERGQPTGTPLSQYLRELNRTPLLTAAEEHALACRVQRGDPEARDHLVRANLRLVVAIARRFQGRGLELADLIAEGNLGLIRAVQDFNPDRGVRFSTYAHFWVKQSIRRGLCTQGHTVVLPAYVAALVGKWRAAALALQALLGRAPTPEEVRAKIGCTPGQMRRCLDGLAMLAAGPVTGAAPSDPEFGLEAVADPWTLDPDQGEAVATAVAALDQLDERSAQVLRLRYGLGGETPLTLTETGRRLGGLCRERVRQIEHDALAELRGVLAEP
jgi:RNA polymerase primary sigma factor